MRIGPVLVAAVGVAITMVAVHAASASTIPRWERRWFKAVNRWPDWVYLLIWLPMQLGNLVVGTVVGLVVAWVLHDLALGIAVVVAAALKLGAERVLRKQMAPYLEVRQRPGTSQPGAILRGADVPSSGPSFPSGHVILVAAVGSVVWSGLPLSLVWLPWVLMVLVALGRVFVGAHNPLDVIAGLGVGLLVGGFLDLLLHGAT